MGPSSALDAPGHHGTANDSRHSGDRSPREIVTHAATYSDTSSGRAGLGVTIISSDDATRVVRNCLLLIGQQLYAEKPAEGDMRIVLMIRAERMAKWLLTQKNSPSIRTPINNLPHWNTNEATPPLGKTIPNEGDLKDLIRNAYMGSTGRVIVGRFSLDVSSASPDLGIKLEQHRRKKDGPQERVDSFNPSKPSRRRIRFNPWDLPSH